MIPAREINALRTALSSVTAGEGDGWDARTQNLICAAFDRLNALPDGVVLVPLTRFEARQALLAIDQLTGGNARDFNEWRLQTHGTRKQWDALLRAERAITLAQQKDAP